MLRLIHSIKLVELADLLDAEVFVPKNCYAAIEYEDNRYQSVISKTIVGLASIDVAGPDHITFLANPLYTKYLSSTKAGAIIIAPKYLSQCNIPGIVTNNPRLGLAKLLQLCHSNTILQAGIHPSCIIGNSVTIGANVTIEAGVVIGNHCWIGDNTIIKANVVLYDNVRIGNNCLIHSNTVVGSDGFGYAEASDHSWVKIPHLGGVVIEDYVEIGSNTSIDRGCIGNTLIKQGVKIDNLVQIAHNVEIGEYTAIAGCVAIGGSTSIGSYCLIGGASSIVGHISIADHVKITGASSITKSLLKAGVYSSGLVAKDNIVWKKNVGRFNLLDQTFKEIFSKIKLLEAKVK